jgi:hypothetical protein
MVEDVTDITALIAYAGLATTLTCRDVDRGGLFYYAVSGTVDNGTIFLATGKGSGRWLRDLNKAKGFNVKWFGAKGDSLTNDTTAINNFFLSNTKHFYFPQGTYLYLTGQWANIFAGDGVIIEGDGSNKTIINFLDTTIKACIETSGTNVSCRYNKLLALTIKGPGKTAGSNINGIYLHNLASVDPNWEGGWMEDIVVRDMSGIGISISNSFSSGMRNVSVKSIGGDGMVMGCGNTFYGFGLGQFSSDIGGTAIWITGGFPVLLSCNIGTCLNGMRFGTGTDYAFPIIKNANIESFSGYGIKFEVGSSPVEMDMITMYAEANTMVVAGIFFAYFATMGKMSNIRFAVKSLGTYTQYFKVGTASNNSVMWDIGNLSPADVTNYLPSNVEKETIIPFGPTGTLAIGLSAIGVFSPHHVIKGNILLPGYDPYVPLTGMQKLNTTNNKLQIYGGAAWEQVVTTVKAGRLTAKVAAQASIASYLVGLVDGSFDISANILVTTSTAHAFTATCTYTDEGGTGRIAIITFMLISGGILVTSIANSNGAVPYMGITQQIRAKAATTIVIATVGTFTSVVYNVEGIIKQTA